MKPPTLTAQQAATLRELLRRHGGSRVAVASILGTTPTTLDSIEIGRVRPHVLARIAAALDMLARVGAT